MQSPRFTPKIKIDSAYQKMKNPPFKLVHFLFKRRTDILRAVLVPSVILIGVVSLSCTKDSVIKTKASSALLAQVALRQQQLSAPTSERLNQMQSMGMKTENIGIQKIFIYLAQQLTTAQTGELASLGITIYPGSWIPPVGNHATGFVLADMPVAKLDTLTAKNYVVKLDTAETKSEPQSFKP